MAEETNDKSGSKVSAEANDFTSRLQSKLKERKANKEAESITKEAEAIKARSPKTATLVSPASIGGKSRTTTFEERNEAIKKDNRSFKKVKKESSGSSDAKSVLKKLGIVALSVVLVIALVLGGYVVYLQSTYSRIEDMRYIAINNNQTNSVMIGTNYSIATFNIGFGAYSQGYSFFMDEGKMITGEKTKGEYSRAMSEDEVRNNTAGAITLLNSKAASDFYFFQEVDTNSSRSYYIDQSKLIADSFSGYSSSFASNFHTGQLFYPINQPIGKVNSGIMTLSKYSASYSIRRTLPVSNGFIDKFFDLDRCFMVTKLPIHKSSKELVLINVHLSAYDDGDIRKEQLAVLYDYIDFEYNKNGNYVIVGGDFNHSLAGEAGIFANSMQVPEWCKTLPEEYNEAAFKKIGFNINYDLSTTIGTCRDASTYYTEGVNLEVILDGFITSANIKVNKTETIDGDYKNSDHNPVRLEFSLI